MNEHATITGATALVARDHINALYWSVPRAARICCILAPVLGALVIAGELVADGSVDLLFITLLAAAFVVWPALMLLGHWRLSEAQKQLRYDIDTEQIAMQDAAGTRVAVPWTLARHAIETKSGFLVALRPAGGRWLPKRAFSPDAVAALRALLQEKLGPAATVAQG